MRLKEQSNNYAQSDRYISCDVKLRNVIQFGNFWYEISWIQCRSNREEKYQTNLYQND